MEATKESLERVAALLDQIADGGAPVELGPFSDQASPPTEADEDAETLRQLADTLRSRAA